MSARIIIGDCADSLALLEDGSVDCCVTSPPYFGLRDYGHEGQMGLEPSPDEFVAAMVSVFREVRRVLRDDGTLWLNIGDSYANDGKWGGPTGGKHAKALHYSPIGKQKRYTGLKPKDLIGIPWMLAFALRADGWYLRQEIIWNKPNPMPESVRDRCTKAHEQIFLLSKSPTYYFEAEAIAERASCGRLRGSGPMVAEGTGRGDAATGTRGDYRTRASKKRGEFDGKTNSMPGREAFRAVVDMRNKRSVWTVPTFGFDMELCTACDAIYRSAQYTRLRKEVDRDAKGLVIARRVFCRCGRRDAWLSHFATYPPDLIEPCILASSRLGGTVLDPFAGAGTTGLVADRHGRNSILLELNPHYAALAHYRLELDAGLFSAVTAE